METTTQADSLPRKRGEGWGEGVQVAERRLHLTRIAKSDATSPRKRGEVKQVRKHA